MRFSYSLLVAGFLLVACNSAEKAISSPANGSNESSNSQGDFTPPPTWKRINACGATFYAPPDVREEKVQGIDSCVRRYRTPDTTFDLDVVPFSAPGYSRKGEYSSKRDFSLTKTKVDGQDAEIISCFDDNVDAHPQGFNYAAVVFVPYITTQRSSFTLWTYSRTAQARAIATNIFSNLHFAQ
jgi:hypothetical protein